MRCKIEQNPSAQSTMTMTMIVIDVCIFTYYVWMKKIRLLNLNRLLEKSKRFCKYQTFKNWSVYF